MLMVMMGMGRVGGDQTISPSASHRTVLSVSKSQSFRVQEETVTSCWSPASSGTNAPLSPLKDIAGSKEEAKTENV